ncbi:unnamed protein product [Anisakis simplex]|uniref:Ribosome biogenesis protein NOP53 n=1 Tax=Anisakis simplex TaxID=6269 RepID=A0A0M3J1E5_ANISI|nr:unnamed protein product [Anisakis simplex]
MGRCIVDDGGEEPSDEMIAQMRDYCLQTTKRRKPKEPSTLKHITSLLPKVEVAGPGASYNPPVAMYESYINGIVDEEIKAEKVESKLEKSLKLAPGQTYISKSEKMAEESAGLFDNEKQSTEAEDGAANRSDEAENAKKSTMRRRTRKERRVEALEKQKKLIDEEYKSVKSAEQAVFAVKKINKEISEELTQVNEKAKLRRKQKWTKKLLGTQQLGRGKFKPEEQPFLMTDELTGSLRELKPQGNILMDRLKSLQKRNMLPVPGEEGRVKSKLKKKLKIKETERRSHKEVTLGSRVI